MKVVFLDFDGVICPGNYSRKDSTNEVYSPKWYAEPIDTGCMNQLNLIVEKTGAKIVVSSAWRLGHTIQELQQILDAGGFKGEVIGKTDHLGGERGEEISEWIEDGVKLFGIEEISYFVILDDDTDMEPLMPFLIHTNFKEGLTEQHAKKAIQMLNQEKTASGIILPQGTPF